MESQANRRWIALGFFGVVAAAIVAVVLISQGGDAAEETTTAAEGDGACREVETPPAKSVAFERPGRALERGEEATAVVRTSCGTFEVALDTERAPKTANSFAYLAEQGFYDGLAFHRVIPGFVVQGGDPEGTGSGGPGYSVDEEPPQNLSYRRGVVAMAKTEVEPPGRSGSQFFVVTAPDAGLPPEYALVGRVSEGFEVVEAIEELGTPEGAPRRTVLIEEVAIERP